MSILQFQSALLIGNLIGNKIASDCTKINRFFSQATPSIYSSCGTPKQMLFGLGFKKSQKRNNKQRFSFEDSIMKTSLEFRRL
jgi:hypothetical protein